MSKEKETCTKVLGHGSLEEVKEANSYRAESERIVRVKL